MEQVPDVDAVIVPVGGGSLITGIAIAVKHLKPDTEVYVGLRYIFNYLLFGYNICLNFCRIMLYITCFLSSTYFCRF